MASKSYDLRPSLFFQIPAADATRNLRYVSLFAHAALQAQCLYVFRRKTGFTGVVLFCDNVEFCTHDSFVFCLLFYRHVCEFCRIVQTLKHFIFKT